MIAQNNRVGTLTFRLDYRMNGRRETVTFGKYGPAGLSLARARELCIDAKRAISEGRSPAIEKQREKRRLLEAKSFGEFGEKWLTAAPMAESTRAMRRSIFERELLPKWRNRLLTEITPDDLRAHCSAIVERSAPATAIHVRDIVKQIYGFAILHGEKVANSADDVGPSSIATFLPKDRSLSPTEIRIMLKLLEKVATLPTIRLGMRLYLQTMVRKSELQDATWDEVDFENAVWTIPKERMKHSKAHNVYPRFAAQGGDAGAIIAPEIGRLAPDRLIGIHPTAATLGFIPMTPLSAEEIQALTDAERVRLTRLQQFMAERSSFKTVQSMRPDALAFALTDSPIGLLSWMSELFTSFGDRGRGGRSRCAAHEFPGLLVHWNGRVIDASLL